MSIDGPQSDIVFTLSRAQPQMKVPCRVVELVFYCLRISMLRSSVWYLVAIGNDSDLIPFILFGKGRSDGQMPAALSSAAW